jgi:hypothetical protein
MTLVSTVTVGAGGAASITFSGIPQNATDILIKASLYNVSGNNNVNFAFNGSSTSFSSRSLYGTGASVASTSRTDNVFGGVANGNSNFSSAGIYIPNYAGSTVKTFSIETVFEDNATIAFQWLHAGLWSSTAAITSITFSPVSNVIAQYSSASLYLITKGSDGATVS